MRDAGGNFTEKGNFFIFTFIHGFTSLKKNN
jgi:hypothetical protein